MEDTKQKAKKSVKPEKKNPNICVPGDPECGA